MLVTACIVGPQIVHETLRVFDRHVHPLEQVFRGQDCKGYLSSLPVSETGCVLGTGMVVPVVGPIEYYQ